MAVALPELLILAALIVALGICYSGKAFAESLIWVVNNTVGKVPLIGGWIGGKAGASLQAIANRMGGYANTIGAQVARNWHFLATVIDRTGWAIYHAVLAAEKLYAYITVVYPLTTLWKVAHDALRIAQRAANAAGKLGDTTTVVIRESARPGSTALGKAISSAVSVATRPLRVELRQDRARLAALEASIAGVADLPADVPPIGLEGLKDALGKIKARLRGLENRGTAVVGLGALAVALSRLGLGTARCTNVQKWNRGLCRADTDLIDALLAGTTLIVGSISLVQLTREVEAVLPYVANATAGFVRETRDTWAPIG